MKKALLILLITCFPLFACENKHCGDRYDECCDSCYSGYKSTGYSTECYCNCWDEYSSCEDSWGSGGCFIETAYTKDKEFTGNSLAGTGMGYREFTGVFGYNFGETYSPYYPEGKALYKESIPVVNLTGFRSFERCSIKITPLTYKIFDIQAGKEMDDESSCEDEMLVLKEFFKRKYGFKDPLDGLTGFDKSLAEFQLSISTLFTGIKESVILQKEAITITYCYAIKKQRYFLFMAISDRKLEKQAEEEFIQMELKKIDPNSL